MNTVFSHIVQKSFSQQYENIATDALAFILDSSDSARNGLMKLLRGIAPELPSLQFRTQQSEDNSRPDMWGFNGSEPRVFIENKFWAGLTENQPVPYLKLLAGYVQPSVLLMVVPAARQETVWRELLRRLENDKVEARSRGASVGVVHSITTSLGSILALTSWEKLLSMIEAELTDAPQARNDLLQLRGLCGAADSQAFLPISPEQVTDQRTPAFILQLSKAVPKALALAEEKGVLSIGTLKKSQAWDRLGQYVEFSAAEVGGWCGIDFDLWKKHGGSPVWLGFSSTKWGRAPEVRGILEQWIADTNGFSASDDDYSIPIDLATGEEMDAVVASIVSHLTKINNQLSKLAVKPV